MTARTLEPVVPYDPSWPAQFAALGARLRALLGDAALRIDHVGSTAVPGLVAKNVIDVQVSVASLEDPSIAALDRAGFVRRSITHDHEPPGVSVPAAELDKRFFNGVPGERRSNVHVRAHGRFNARYALLWRDYLRCHPTAASAYGAVKVALARVVEGDVEAYYDVKDPVFDIVMAGAEEWAEHTGWQAGPTDA